MSLTANTHEPTIPPYSMTVVDAAMHFGFTACAIYNMVHKGQLHRGYHYKKVGKRVLIIREKFIEWIEGEDNGGKVAQRVVIL